MGTERICFWKLLLPRKSWDQPARESFRSWLHQLIRCNAQTTGAAGASVDSPGSGLLLVRYLSVKGLSATHL